MSGEGFKALEGARRAFRIVALGGTFDRLHKGHEALLLEALNLGEKVVLGLTTDEFARSLGKSHMIQSYGERRRALEEFLRSVGANHRVEIVPLSDPYGVAAESPEIEALIVSAETKPRGLELNELRKGKGLRPLSIVVVPMVLGLDGKPISSTAVRLGRIKRDGTLIEAPPDGCSEASGNR